MSFQPIQKTQLIFESNIAEVILNTVTYSDSMRTYAFTDKMSFWPKLKAPLIFESIKAEVSLNKVMKRVNTYSLIDFI
jgi:hypothetical protein